MNIRLLLRLHFDFITIPLSSSQASPGGGARSNPYAAKRACDASRPPGAAAGGVTLSANPKACPYVLPSDEPLGCRSPSKKRQDAKACVVEVPDCHRLMCVGEVRNLFAQGQLCQLHLLVRVPVLPRRGSHAMVHPKPAKEPPERPSRRIPTRRSCFSGAARCVTISVGTLCGLPLPSARRARHFLIEVHRDVPEHVRHQLMSTPKCCCPSPAHSALLVPCVPDEPVFGLRG